MTFRKKPVPESWEFETMNIQKQPEKIVYLLLTI